MIVDFILGLVVDLISWLIAQIPNPLGYATGTASALAGPVAYLAGLTGSLSIWVPWGMIAGTMAGLWLIRMGMATVQLIIKLYAMIRGGAS